MCPSDVPHRTYHERCSKPDGKGDIAMHAGKPAQEPRDWREPLLHARSKAERVADALEARVMAEGLSPGAFLGTKAVLREQLAVSPATLDTALGVLTDRGVVEVRQGVKGGVRVAQAPSALWMGRSRWPLRGGAADAGRAGQAMALYLALQPHIAARAVGHLTEADRERLETARARLQQAEGDPNAYYAAHSDAHQVMLEASHDDVLIGVVGLVTSILDQETGPAQPPPAEDVAAYTRERIAVHVEVIDGILGGDLGAAWRGLLQHGLTPTDEQVDSTVLPAGAVDLQRQWARSFSATRRGGTPMRRVRRR